MPELAPQVLFRFRLIIIRIGRRSLVPHKEVSIEQSRNGLKGARRLVEVKKLCQVILCTSISKVERSFSQVEVVFDEAQDAAEIHPVVVHITRRRIR
jgi:hypothetical protein